MSKWTGELRLVAIDGDRIVFYRDPNDEIPLTIGRRYACGIVELDDHENLAPTEPERSSVKRTVRHPSNVSAILAKDSRFQQFAAANMRSEGAGNLPANEETATEYIRRRCAISSRADLDSNPLAHEEFQRIELEYYRSIDDRRP